MVVNPGERVVLTVTVISKYSDAEALNSTGDAEEVMRGPGSLMPFPRESGRHRSFRIEEGHTLNGVSIQPTRVATVLMGTDLHPVSMVLEVRVVFCVLVCCVLCLFCVLCFMHDEVCMLQDA